MTLNEELANWHNVIRTGTLEKHIVAQKKKDGVVQ